MAFTALQVGCHQRQLLAFEIHLISKGESLHPHLARLICGADVEHQIWIECYVCTNLSYKQIPHHLSGGVRYYLTLQEFDS